MSEAVSELLPRTNRNSGSEKRIPEQAPAKASSAPLSMKRCHPGYMRCRHAGAAQQPIPTFQPGRIDVDAWRCESESTNAVELAVAEGGRKTAPIAC